MSVRSVSKGERRLLLEAQVAASRFFRRELLRASNGWAARYLRERGAGHVLSAESRWSVGYAPDSWSRLVDHLRSRGFDFQTLLDAGLAMKTGEGQTIDRFRDQLMLLSRDERMDPVGFVGLRLGLGARPYYATTPPTPVHRRSSALVGVFEQSDLLAGGAMPVLVNDPADATAVEKVSRLSLERWAGVPLCDTLMSRSQAGVLGRHCATDTVVVVLTDAGEGRRAAVGYMADLSRFFRRVRAVELPTGHSPATLALAENGVQRLHDALLTTRPLADYRAGARDALSRPADLMTEQETSAPGIDL